MLDFLNTVNQTVFYKTDFREKIQLLFKEVMAKYKEMGGKYDEETDHYNNDQKQKEWNLFLRIELEKFAQGSLKLSYFTQPLYCTG